MSGGGKSGRDAGRQLRLDALWRHAIAMQQEAAREGFDWPETGQVIDKLVEELEELRAARSQAERTEELGDLLFVLANLARHWQLDAPEALDAALAKFAERYAHVMADPSALPAVGSPERLAAMEARWQQAKRMKKADPGLRRSPGDTDG